PERRPGAAGRGGARGRRRPPPGGVDEVTRPLAATFPGWVKAGGPPDEAGVEAVLAGLKPAPRTDAEFFAGWFLANRGLGDRAAGHWRRCAGSSDGTRWIRTHAK